MYQRGGVFSFSSSSFFPPFKNISSFNINRAIVFHNLGDRNYSRFSSVYLFLSRSSNPSKKGDNEWTGGCRVGSRSKAEKSR